jgi:anaerobic selenocysteine-containing dehydrogenase
VGCVGAGRGVVAAPLACGVAGVVKRLVGVVESDRRANPELWRAAAPECAVDGCDAVVVRCEQGHGWRDGKWVLVRAALVCERDHRVDVTP